MGHHVPLSHCAGTFDRRRRSFECGALAECGASAPLCPTGGPAPHSPPSQHASWHARPARPFQARTKRRQAAALQSALRARTPPRSRNQTVAKRPGRRTRLRGPGLRTAGADTPAFAAPACGRLEQTRRLRGLGLRTAGADAPPSPPRRLRGPAAFAAPACGRLEQTHAPSRPRLAGAALDCGALAPLSPQPTLLENACRTPSRRPACRHAARAPL